MFVSSAEFKQKSSGLFNYFSAVCLIEEDVEMVSNTGFGRCSTIVDQSRLLWYICTMPEDEGVINLRKVPISVIRRAKAAAALEGKTLRIYVIEAIQEKIRKKPK